MLFNLCKQDKNLITVQNFVVVGFLLFVRTECSLDQMQLVQLPAGNLVIVL